jgi:hypothetical protein
MGARKRKRQTAEEELRGRTVTGGVARGPLDQTDLRDGISDGSLKHRSPSLRFTLPSR